MVNKKLATIFGQKVRILRKKLGVTQETLAEMSKLHPTYIGVIERGDQSPTLDTVEKIASALKVKENDLFYFSSQDEHNNEELIVKEKILARLSGKNLKKLKQILDILTALDP